MRTIVYGNGKSRLKWDLKQNLHDDIITWGCNRIYNDTVVDNLVAVDYWVQHDIVESGYPKNNKCWFTDWEVLPIEYDVEYLKEQYLAQGCSTFIENDNTNKTKKVVSGRLHPPHQALYVTWLDGTENIEYVDFPIEWSSGSTTMHLACQQGAKEIYLMGFDLSENPLNNVYEELQKHQKLNHFQTLLKWKLEPHSIWYRSDWANEMRTVMREFSDTDFIWIEPHEHTSKFDMNNLTYDTYENIRRKICR